MLSNVTWLCFFASYVFAAALEATRIRHKGAFFRWAALGFGFAGFVAHTAYLFERARRSELPPLLSSEHDWLLVLAWLAVLTYLFVGLLDRNFSFGLFLMPLVVIMVGAARFVSDTTNATLNAQRGWGMLHAAMWALGATGVVVGFVFSVMYLIQHRRLRQKADLHDGVELPSLERLARINWWSIIVSVPLLTIGMATGVGLSLTSNDQAPPVPLTQPNILISALVWVGMMALFVWLLAARRTPGRLVAWRTLWAAGFLLVTLLVLQIVSRGGVHGMAGKDDVSNPPSGVKRLAASIGEPGLPTRGLTLSARRVAHSGSRVSHPPSCIPYQGADPLRSAGPYPASRIPRLDTA